VKTDALAASRASIAMHSKSFALASALLGSTARDEAAAVYAFCRRVDDAVDTPSERAPLDVVGTLRHELCSIYGGEAQSDPVLAAFQEVVKRHDVPRHYANELLAGMAMDARGAVYREFDDLLVYCYRVAGTVGLMMSHVLGVRDEVALRNAAHLGMAMQLTNICRDVHEDWQRGRLYLPDSVLYHAGARGLREHLRGPLPREARKPVGRAIRDLLSSADVFYESGERGIPLLPFRAAIAVRTARLVYADIGRVILSRDADPFAPRAVVSTPRKLGLALFAVARTVLDTPRQFRRAELPSVVGFGDVLSN
jgi:phytoene synthase